MLTTCKDKLCNPHKKSVLKLLNLLVRYDNDYQRSNVELKNLQQEFKQKVENAIFQCSEKRKLACGSVESFNEFQKNVDNIDNITDCYNKRISELNMRRQSIIKEAGQRLEIYDVEKYKLKEFHDKTVDHFKAYAGQSDDPAIVRNCEKVINDMHKQFVKEVDLIKNSESVLEPFFKVLNDCNSKLLHKCCDFQKYKWMPKGKSTEIIEPVVKEIKNSMENTLTKAFAQLHIHHTADVKSFLASYLMNSKRNEEIMKAKLQLFELSK